MLRVAIAGAGMVSLYHLRAWSTVAGARVVAIADPDCARAEARALEFGVGATFADAQQMLDKVRPDALDIAAGHAAHRMLCLAAADRGIPVLCQKPLAPTLVEARAIIADVGTRVRLMIHENWRFRPWYKQARDWLDDGAIGVPEELELATRSSGFLLREGKRPALERQPMLARIPRLMIGEVLVHHLDVACSMLGPMQVVAASTHHGSEGVLGETTAAITLRGPATSARVSGNFTDPDASPFPTDAMRLVGSVGTIVLAGNVLQLDGHQKAQARFDLIVGYQDSYDAAITHFANALVHSQPFATSPGVHLQVLTMAEEAYRLADHATSA